MRFPSEYRRKVVSCFVVILSLMFSVQLQRLLQQYRDATSESVHSAAPSDFPVYYVAALTARQQGDLYYTPSKSSVLLASVPEDTPWGRTAKSAGFDRTLFFIYPPLAALLLEPVTLFHWPMAFLLWRVALTAMAVISTYLILRLTGRHNVLAMLVIAVAGVFSFFPFTETVYQGQIDGLILLLWAGAIYLIAAEQSVWSALLFAVGTMVKLSPVIVVGVFIVRRQWKWLLSYVGWMTLLLGISVWKLGWQNHVFWFSNVFPRLSSGTAYFANKSIAAFILELYLRRVPVDFDPAAPVTLLLLVKAFSLALYCGVLFYFWRKNKRPTKLVYELIVLSLVSILVSPVSWRHHYLLALIPLIFLWVESSGSFWETTVLAAATLAMGTVFPDYAIVAMRNPVLDLALSSTIPITSLLLLSVLLSNYRASPLAEPFELPRPRENKIPA